MRGIRDAVGSRAAVLFIADGLCAVQYFPSSALRSHMIARSLSLSLSSTGDPREKSGGGSQRCRSGASSTPIYRSIKFMSDTLQNRQVSTSLCTTPCDFAVQFMARQESIDGVARPSLRPVSLQVGGRQAQSLPGNTCDCTLSHRGE